MPLQPLTVNVGDLPSTFAASTRQDSLPFSKSGILSGDRLDTIIIQGTAQLNKAAATSFTWASAEDLAKIVDAILGNVTVSAPKYGADIVRQVAASELIKLINGAHAQAAFPSLPAMGEAETCGTTGQFKIDFSIPIALTFRNQAIGATYAAWGGYIDNGEVQLYTGTGTATINGGADTWTVDTTASNFTLTVQADVLRGANPVKGPTVQYWVQNGSSDFKNSTPDGVHLLLAQLKDQPAAFGTGTNIANGLQLSSGDENRINPQDFNPLRAAARFYAGAPQLGANMARTYNGSHDANDLGGPGVREFAPITFLTMTEDDAFCPVGVQTLEFKSGWNAAGAIGGIRVPTQAKKIQKGAGECACLCDGVPVRSVANAKLRPYVALA